MELTVHIQLHHVESLFQPFAANPGLSAHVLRAAHAPAPGGTWNDPRRLSLVECVLKYMRAFGL